MAGREEKSWMRWKEKTVGAESESEYSTESISSFYRIFDLLYLLYLLSTLLILSVLSLFGYILLHFGAGSSVPSSLSLPPGDHPPERMGDRESRFSLKDQYI